MQRLGADDDLSLVQIIIRGTNYYPGYKLMRRDIGMQRLGADGYSHTPRALVPVPSYPHTPRALVPVPSYPHTPRALVPSYPRN